MIGQTIGNYTVTDRLGAGGMGEVYRAHDNRLGRDVALKVLPEGFASDPDRLARFEREARLLAGLNHPNIGAIYGVEEADGNTFLVLELVEGEDLSVRLARGPMDADETLGVALQVAEALEAAHEQGIIHRDLKPGNIVLSNDGRAKVLDFGLAKALETEEGSSHDLSHSPTVMASSPTVAGVILGTAAYMSPEQARGKAVDKRADVFAFGAVVWEMLTGRQLFSGETVSDTLAAVLRETPDFDDLPAGTPSALCHLLARCLEKDARRRLRDIGEARIAIEDIRAGKTGETNAPAEPAAGRGGMMRAVAIAGWIVAVVIGAIFFVQTRSHSPVTLSETTVPLRKFAIPMAADDASAAAEFDPAISPDGRYIAYLSNDQLWLRDLTSPDGHPIPDTEGAAQPFWSPDSKTIAFGVGSEILRVAREGGRPTLIAAFDAGLALGPAASAGWDVDNRIVASTAESGLYEVPAQGGDLKEILAPAEGETDFHQVAALPGGKGWIFVIHSEKSIGNLDALDPDGNRHELLRIGEMINDPAWSPSGHIIFERSGATNGIWALPFSLDRLEPTGEPFLVAAGGKDPSVSSDGTLVYTRGVAVGHGQLTWYDREGNVLGTLGKPIDTLRPFPELSPDDSQVLLAEHYGDSRELYLYDVASGNRRRLTFDDHRNDMGRFYPDGKRILWYESSAYTTYIAALDGGGEPRAIENAAMTVVTNDGKTFVMARRAAKGWSWSIHTMPADGGESTQIVATGNVDWWPMLSPDNRYLAYTSNETGRDEVFVTTFPDATKRWQVSSDGGDWPRWRGDGRELFYAKNGNVMAVAVEAGKGGGLTFGVPLELFRVPNLHWSARWPDGFDVTADGQRFIALAATRSGTDAESPSIVVVQNWYEEFANTR